MTPQIAHGEGRIRAQATGVLDGRTFRARLGYATFGPVAVVRVRGIDVPAQTTPAGDQAARALALILAANAANSIALPLALTVVERTTEFLLADVEIQLPVASNRKERRRRAPGPVSGLLTVDAADEMVKKGHAVRTVPPAPTVH